MRNLVKWMAALSCLAVASPALATNGMRMIGFGPVQNAMGGASVAAPLDAATALSNPAGLTALDRRADLSGTFFDPKVKYSATGGASGQSMSSDRGASYLPTAGFTWSGLVEGLSLGAGIAGVSGMGVDYGADLYGSSTMTSFSNLRIAPAASYKLRDGLSVGVAVNLMWAQMKYAVAGATGMLPRDVQDSFGYGATVGVQYTPVDLVTLGLAYETKSQFQDFSWTIPSHTIQTPGGPATVPGGREKLAFDQPQMVTFGAAVRPLPILLVAADVEWINWSATNGTNEPTFSTNPNLTGAQAWNMSWSDQWVFKLGAQVAATKDLKIRAGYNYGKSPLDPGRAFENIAFPAIAEHHVTLGLGYDFGSLSVNVAGMYVPEAKLSGGNASQGLPSYTTRMSQVAFDLGVAYRM